MVLLDETVKKLLEKFGEGNHKPGSGSAAAFEAMIASKLLSTVISLTADPKRKPQYDSVLPHLVGFQERIETFIFPRLAELFQADSDQFDLTIKTREARNAETDIVKKNKLKRQALEELKVSIEIPLQIGILCVELADMAAFVFDNGFQSARGDSQVALGGVVSALSGCISIIRLNVLSFSSDEYQYTKSVLAKVAPLDTEYERLRNIEFSKIKILKDEFDHKIPLFEGIESILTKYRGKRNPDIEACVNELQNLAWDNKNVIWKKNVPSRPLDILRPESILTGALGYDFYVVGRFGVFDDYGDIKEVNGFIDQNRRLVAVSDTFTKQIRRFTAAHELGHAILHEQVIMHRDAPFDANGKPRKRDTFEVQADRFASAFLMPAKGVKDAFKKIFSVDTLVLNEDTAFRFGGKTAGEIKSEVKSKRNFARMVASAQRYDYNTFSSLADQFNVSKQTMAIRLEELDLISL